MAQYAMRHAHLLNEQVLGMHQRGSTSKVLDSITASYIVLSLIVAIILKLCLLGQLQFNKHVWESTVSVHGILRAEQRNSLVPDL